MKTKNNIHVLSRGVIIDQGQILLCKTLDLLKRISNCCGCL